VNWFYGTELCGLYLYYVTLGFLAKIYFAPLLYQPGGCLGCPEKQTSSRDYNLFVGFVVFQPKWNGIQNTYKNYQNPAKSYCFLGYFQSFSILAGKQKPKSIRWTLVDHTASFDTQVIPRGRIIVEISWFLHFVLRFLTCSIFFHYFQNKAQFPLYWV
jgi:hypothetical protein